MGYFRLCVSWKIMLNCALNTQVITCLRRGLDEYGNEIWTAPEMGSVCTVDIRTAFQGGLCAKDVVYW